MKDMFWPGMFKMLMLAVLFTSLAEAYQESWNEAFYLAVIMLGIKLALINFKLDDIYDKIAEKDVPAKTACGNPIHSSADAYKTRASRLP